MLVIMFVYFSVHFSFFIKVVTFQHSFFIDTPPPPSNPSKFRRPIAAHRNDFMINYLNYKNEQRILVAGPFFLLKSYESKAYPLILENETFSVYCHMNENFTGNGTNGDGGWTLVMKINGLKVVIALSSQSVHYTTGSDMNDWVQN